LNRGSGLLIFLGGASILLGLALEKDPVDDQLRSFVWNPWCFPNFDLLFHRLKIPLNPAIPDRENVDQTQNSRSFCKSRAGAAVEIRAAGAIKQETGHLLACNRAEPRS